MCTGLALWGVAVNMQGVPGPTSGFSGIVLGVRVGTVTPGYSPAEIQGTMGGGVLNWNKELAPPTGAVGL